MRTTIPKITLRDDRPDSVSNDADRPSSLDGIPVIELDSSDLEERVSEVPASVHGGLTTSARQGAIAGPMGPLPTPPED